MDGAKKAMTDKKLWSRGPWSIVLTGNGRMRVEHGMHSDYPVLYTHKKPWSVGWDFYSVPKDVRAKTRAILVKRELARR